MLSTVNIEQISHYFGSIHDHAYEICQFSMMNGDTSDTCQILTIQSQKNHLSKYHSRNVESSSLNS